MNIVSFSGGKDSTAMLLMMIEHKIQIDYIVFCDTGVEFPGMYKHIKKVEKYIGRKITIVKSKNSYEYFLGEHVKRNGTVGYGHPDFRNRWCTQVLKKSPFKKFIKSLNVDKSEVIEYHGIAFDEIKRTEKNKENGRIIKYPLVDWEITEKMALEYCYNKGFNWDGLYEDFVRASCFTCPMSRIGELRTLYNKYPELWIKLQNLDSKSFRKFRSDYTLQQLTDRFKKENYNKIS